MKRGIQKQAVRGRGIRKQMLTVRELFGKMRTHSVASTVAAVTLATAVCGAVVFKAIGGIRMVTGGKSRDAEIISMIEEDDAVLMGQNDAMRLQLETMYVSLQSLKENVNSGTQVIETIERSMNEMSGTDDVTKRLFRSMNTKLVTLDRSMTDAFSRISEIADMLETETFRDEKSREELGVKMGEMGTVMAQIIDQYASLSTDVSALTARLKESGAGASDLMNAVDVLQQSLTDTAWDMDGMRMQMTAMETLITETQAYMTKRLDDSIDSVDRLSEQVQQSGRNVEGLSEQVTASNRNVEGLSEQVLAANRSVDALSEQVQTSSQSVDALSEQVQTSSQSVDTLSEQVQTSNRSVDALSEQVQTSNRSVDSLSEQLMASNRNVESLSEQLLQSNRNVESLSEQVTASNEVIGTLSEQLDTSTRTIDELSEQLTETRSQLDVLNERVTQAGASVEQAAAEIAGVGQAARAGTTTMNTITRNDGFITVAFEMNGVSTFTRDPAAMTTHTFDFTPYVSNYASLTARDFLIKSVSISSSDPTYAPAGVVVSFNMDKASYDPATGILSITDSYLSTAFGNVKGSVTFAVLGGVP